jgi:hypothetical protein
MAMTEKKPEQAPKTKYKLKFYLYEAIGVSIIALIPVLAIIGVFGTNIETSTTSSENIEVEVKYPTKFRYKTISPFNITVKNKSDSAESVKVYIEEAYLSNFSNIRFTPEPLEIVNRYYVFDLGTLQAEDSKIISGELQAERYGKFNTVLIVETTETETNNTKDSLEILLQTWSIP